MPDRNLGCPTETSDVGGHGQHAATTKDGYYLRSTNPKTGKPRSLLSTLIGAKDAGPEPKAAVTTPSISKPQATTTAEAAVRTSTLSFTFHDRVVAFFASDDYAPIQESVNSELRGLVKKLALIMAEDMDLGESPANRPAPKYKSALVIWREQQPAPPPNANKSTELFLACIMSEIAINSAVSGELPNLPDRGEIFYRDKMRLAITHLNIHLINEPSEIKRYWKNETSNHILVLLSEANAYVFDSTPSPNKRAPLFSSSGCYSARSAPTPSSAETVVYETSSPSQPKATVTTPLREGYVNRAARPRKTASMIEVNLDNEDAIRRNLAYDSDKSSPDKPSPHKSKMSDDAAAELLQWQEWHEWHEEATQDCREPKMDGDEVEKHPDQSDGDSIISDHSMFGRIDLVDAQGNITPNCLHPMICYCAKGKLSTELRHSLHRLAGMQTAQADFFVARQSPR